MQRSITGSGTRCGQTSSLHLSLYIPPILWPRCSNDIQDGCNMARASGKRLQAGFEKKRRESRDQADIERDALCKWSRGSRSDIMDPTNSIFILLLRCCAGATSAITSSSDSRVSLCFLVSSTRRLCPGDTGPLRRAGWNEGLRRAEQMLGSPQFGGWKEERGM